MTLPFFAAAGVLLTFFGHPRDESSSPVVLIVTSEALNPAFVALETWNEARGCPTRVVTLPRPGASWLAQLDVPETDVRGLLLGGDRAQVPSASDPSATRMVPEAPHVQAGVPYAAREPGVHGVPVLRASVRDLEEAWAFFEACRATGQTLDRLLAAELAAGDAPRGKRTAADLAVAARPH